MNGRPIVVHRISIAGESMNSISKLVQRAVPVAPLTLGPLNATSLRDQAYALLKNAIADTDIYDPSRSCASMSGN